MNKFFRSMLLTGIVAVGLAGCGDDVTIVDPPPPPPPPPPPTPQVRAVEVTPDNITVAPGQTIQMTASVTADSGATPTITWSTSDATKATVSTTGLVSVLATATSGPVAIRATAAANGSSASDAATLNVVGTTVTAVSITPATATVNAGTSLSPPQSIQLAANVTGTNGPAQTVTWSSLDATIATVSATGLVTANNTATPGNVVIRACSTVNTAICGTMALTVTVPQPATVQIQSVTFTNGAGNQVPVVLTAVGGQIEIGLNVEPGDRNITRVDALIGGQVVATQTFTSAGPAAAAPEAAPTLVILSTNTRQLRQSGGIFVPVVFNGNSAITANLYVAGSSTPIASNAVPVVMTNPDALVRTSTATLAQTTATPSAVSLNDGNTYYKGTQDVSGFHYAAFGKAVPATVTMAGSVCLLTENLVPGAASATGGIALAGRYGCGVAGVTNTGAAVEGGNAVTGVGAVAYAAGALGPDGTALVAPGGISSVGSAFQLNGESRWNLITPAVGPNPGPAWIDNKGPAVTIGNVAFNDSFDQPWVNAAYAFAQDMTALDGAGTVGVGVSAAAYPRARQFTTACVAPNLPTQTGADFTETLTSNVTDGKRICTYAEDLLGNASSTGASNYFGVDFVAPAVRFMSSTAATPAPVLTASTVSATANTTIYSIAASAGPPVTVGAPPAHAFGIEALDTRSGFHQGAFLGTCGVAPGCYPAAYTFTRLTAAGTANATIVAGGYGLATLLSDTYVRGAELEILGAGVAATGLGGVGYYNWSGNATDRAGNTSTTIARNFAADHLLVPNITGLGFASAFYTPGAAAPFGFSANDDLEVIDATVAVTMNIPTGAGTALRYPFGSLSPLGTRWDATITNVVNGAAASIGYFLFRVDEMCTAAATPYAACPAPAGAPYITTSKPPVVVGDTATTNLQYNNAGGNNLGKLPTSVSANVNDVAGQPAAAPIAAPMLPSQFSPAVGINQQWAAADLIAWSGSTTAVAGSIVATHVASTSIVVPYFDSASLWGLVGTEWVFCSTYPAPVLTDNGSHRFWTYTVAVPGAATPCAGVATFRVMGTKAGAGLFGPVT